jgi:peptide/nickel transport system permease protein
MATDNDSIFADVEAPDEEQTRDWARTFRLWKEVLGEQYQILMGQLSVKISVAILLVFIFVAIFAPVLAPHPPGERLTQPGSLLFAKWMEPSFINPESPYLLGTTAAGYSILSQLIYGTRSALIVGFASAFFTMILGTMVGLTAGYYGGRIDDFLMRTVDFLFGMPLLPTVIVLVTILGPSLVNVIIAVVILQWRSMARVIRSQALSLRERPFVKSAKLSGASDLYIIIRHLAPNVLPMTFLYGSFAIAWAILTQAGVAFLGLGDPNTFSWGMMLQSSRAYNALSFGAWWWFIPPGICIGLLVISGYLIGQGLEEVTNPELQQ